MSLIIEEWSSEHPEWQELVQAIADEGQTQWAFASFFEQFQRHFLVALQKGKIVGFVMFVVWEIGPHDRNYPPLQLNGRRLTEAKVIAFGVAETHRRKGIGRALQESTLKRAKELDCYQVRSVSSHEHRENHQLKLSMGFGVEPMEREREGLVFIMPLGKK